MFRAIDALHVRVAAHPATMSLPAWPDLDDPQSRLRWLHQVWAIAGIAEAIEAASPVLASEVQRIRDGENRDSRQGRRAVMSVARYLLRGIGRSTPFGLFAGVAPTTAGPEPSVRWGREHRRVQRPNPVWLTDLISGLESSPETLATATVMVNNLAFVRGPFLMLTMQRSESNDQTLTEVSVRRTAPVEVMMGYARTPIAFVDLAAKLAADFPHVPSANIHGMLREMTRRRLLVTSVRPPMVEPAPLNHIRTVLPGVDLPSEPTSSTHVDLAVDLELVVPDAILRDAEIAAKALTMLTAYPDGMQPWQDYHEAFLDRYGPEAVVPLLDLIDPTLGLGYPATFRDSQRTSRPATLTDRDEQLLILAQRAALHGQIEVALDDKSLRAIATTEPARLQVPPHVELHLQILATDMCSVQNGHFELLVAGAARAAGATTGRFLDMFAPADRDRFQDAYAALPTRHVGAALAQISCAPLPARADALGRAPAMLPELISIGEHEQPGALRLDDLGVTGDMDGMTLVSLTTGRVVEPTIFNAVEFRYHSHPLVRFLCELSRSRTAVYMPFSWGPAGKLPFTPRLRVGRTVLVAARWTLMRGDVPGPDIGWAGWRAAFDEWRTIMRVPGLVYLVESDNLLRIDLTVDVQLALVRRHLERHNRVRLEEAPAPEAFGWIDGHAHEIVVPLASPAPPRPAPRAATQAAPVRPHHGHLPGHGDWLYAKLYSHHIPEILVRLPDLFAEWELPARWWFLPYRDPDRHLRLRVRLADPHDYGTVATRVGAWAAMLRDEALVNRLQFDTYLPEHGRFGHGPAMAAAEDVFAADSAAALAQIQIASPAVPLDVLTVASMVEMAVAFAASEDAAMRCLAKLQPPPNARVSRSQRSLTLSIADPSSDWQALRGMPGVDRLIEAWIRRRTALTAYRMALLPQREPLGVLPSLMHLHHVRAFGIDPDREGTNHKLAQAVATRHNALAASAA